MTHPETATGRRRSTASLLTRRTTLGLLGAGALGSFAPPASATVERETKPIEVATYSVVDENGASPPFDDDGTLLYDAYKLQQLDPPEPLVPVPGPDGEQLTWGEFSAVGGDVTLKCVKKGTHVSVHAHGLLPKGLYTVWVAVLEDGGNIVVGAAPLGDNDGDQSDFRASASGRGSIAAIDESDEFTAEKHPDYEGYETPDCLLSVSDGQIVEVAGAYHYDDMTHGPKPRPDAVEQFSILFGV